MSGEYNTYLQLLDSKETLKSEEPSLDFSVCLGFILLYLKTRLSTIEELDIRNKKMLLDILDNHFVIKDNKLYYDVIVIELEYLIDLAKKVESYEAESNNVIEFKPSNIIRMTNPPSRAKIIQLELPKELSNEERGLIFNSTFRVDKETRRYIHKTEDNFMNKMDEILDSLLKQELHTLDDTTKELLAGLLEVQALDYYLTHDPHFLDDTIIYRASIGIGKFSSDHPELEQIEKKIEKAKGRLIEIDYQERVIDFCSHLSDTAQERFESEKNRISNIIMYLFQEQYQTRQKPYIYNPYLIKSLMQSIKDNHVEVINRGTRTRLKFFTIKDDEADFHCTIPLEVLTDLLNREENIQLKKK